MKIKELTVSKGVKVSVNYNSITVNVSLTVEVDENEDVKAVREELSQMINNFIDDELVKQRKYLIQK